jgi:hypothetical protein
MKAADVMVRNVIAVDPGTPMTRAVSNVLNAGNEFTIHPSGQSEEK